MWLELHLCGPANETGIPDVIFCYNINRPDKCSTDGHLQIHDHNEGFLLSLPDVIHANGLYFGLFLGNLQFAFSDHPLSYNKASLNRVSMLSSSPINSDHPDSLSVNNKTALFLTLTPLEDAAVQLMCLDSSITALYYADDHIGIFSLFASSQLLMEFLPDPIPAHPHGYFLKLLLLSHLRGSNGAQQVRVKLILTVFQKKRV